MIIRARRKEIKNVWKIPEILKIERTPVETFFITALIWLFVSNILWILVTSLYEILALWNHKKSSFKPILLTSFLCRCSRDVNLNSEEIVRHFSGICFYHFALLVNHAFFLRVKIMGEMLNENCGVPRLLFHLLGLFLARLTS